MLHIGLEQMRFHAAIGLYPEERILGNDFLVDIQIEIEEGDQPIETLPQTVDYENLYELVRIEMNQRHQLMESVAQNFMQAIQKKWPQIAAAEISIRKLNPPLPGPTGSSTITLSKTF